jgi:hypothetical protein
MARFMWKDMMHAECELKGFLVDKGQTVLRAYYHVAQIRTFLFFALV